MKILIVNTVNFGENGITSVIMNYYKNMNKQDLHIDFIVINEIKDKYKREIEKYNSEFYYIKRPKNLRIIIYMLELYKVIKKNKYDIIHIHGNSALMTIETITSFFGKIPVRITHSHNTTCDYLKLNKILYPIFKKTYTHAFACGTEAGKWLFKNDDFELINNGIDLSQFHYNEALRNKYREKIQAGNKKVIGHIGNFVYSKNHDFLIDIFNELLKVDSNYLLLLISDGQLLEKMKEKVKNLGIENNVIFLGKTFEISEYLHAMDIFVLPSHYEGLPVVLIEAQALGLPCLVSDRVSLESKITNLIDFIPIDNIDLWVKKIISQNLDNRRVKINDYHKEIENKGYNVCKNADRMKKLYLKYLKEKYDLKD